MHDALDAHVIVSLCLCALDLRCLALGIRGEEQHKQQKVHVRDESVIPGCY